MSNNQIYLLGFVQDERQLPPLGKAKLNLMTSGKHSALWIGSPLKIFPSKEEFLWAVLSFFEDVGEQKIAILPVKMGMSVPCIANLAELIKKYQTDLENFFRRVSGCCEYTLSLVPLDNSTENDRSGLAISEYQTIHNGKDYLESVKSREQQHKAQIKEVEIELANICAGMASMIKDYRVEKTLSKRETLDLAFLITYADEGRFLEEAANLTSRLGNSYQVHWTGPWPAYHFVSFKFQADCYLTMESLNWSVGG